MGTFSAHPRPNQSTQACGSLSPPERTGAEQDSLSVMFRCRPCSIGSPPLGWLSYASLYFLCSTQAHQKALSLRGLSPPLSRLSPLHTRYVLTDRGDVQGHAPLACNPEPRSAEVAPRPAPAPHGPRNDARI